MTIELEKLKAELKTEIMAEITAKKRKDSAWAKAKKELRERINDVFTPGDSWRVVEATAVIGRMALDVNVVNSFTDEDIKTIEEMLGELVAVCVKYKKQKNVA